MRGIYKVTPENWPEGLFFGDPCNKMAEGGRPKKEMVRNMCVQLFKMYQATNVQVTEDENVIIPQAPESDTAGTLVPTESRLAAKAAPYGNTQNDIQIEATMETGGNVQNGTRCLPNKHSSMIVEKPEESNLNVCGDGIQYVFEVPLEVQDAHDSIVETTLSMGPAQTHNSVCETSLKRQTEPAEDLGENLRMSGEAFQRVEKIFGELKLKNKFKGTFKEMAQMIEKIGKEDLSKLAPVLLRLLQFDEKGRLNSSIN